MRTKEDLSQLERDVFLSTLCSDLTLIKAVFGQIERDKRKLESTMKPDGAFSSKTSWRLDRIQQVLDEKFLRERGNSTNE